MATLKKKNPETGNWETWASGSASGIYSVNPKLLKEEDQKYITVDDALVRDREDIELMKKNISWLALHGGGGSGGGGGSDAVNSIEFINKGNVVDSIVWTATSKVVEYRLISSRSSTRFNVVILLDGSQIWSGNTLSPSSTSNRSVTINNIRAFSDNAIHTLRIVATDATGVETYAECTLAELSVMLSAPNSITVDLNDVPNSGLNIVYRTTEIGLYNLYYSRDRNLEYDLSLAEGSIELNIPTTRTLDYSIPYNTLLPIISIATGQTYNYYFVLINAQDSVIRSEQASCSVLITSPDNVAVSRVSLSTDEDNPTVVSKNSILYANFIAYLSGNSVAYKYDIYAEELSDGQDTGNTFALVEDGRGEYGRTTVVQYNEFPSSSWFNLNTYYKVTTIVTDINNPAKQGTLVTYIFVSTGAGETLPVNAESNTIFDFYVFGSNARVNNWVSNNSEFFYNGANHNLSTSFDLYNMGGKSTITSAYCRFSNKAHGIIQPTTMDGVEQKWFPENLINGLIGWQRPYFTLSVSYYNDYTPDNNRTILKLGDYLPAEYTDDGNATGSGILINNHDYYIKLGGSAPLVTGKLQDSIFHQIDIVFGEVTAETQEQNSVFIKVYHNGILLQTVEDVDKNIYAFRNFNRIYIACDENEENYTNINLQSVALYNTYLTPYQITCKYINNLARYYLSGENNNELNHSIIEEKMKSNLILYDSNTEKFSCALWSDVNDNFSDSSWINIENNNITLSSNLAEAAKIPVVVLDFSTNSNWTWENFTNISSVNRLITAENTPIYYFVNGINVLPAGTTCAVNLQGTTTLLYAIKNLNIDFGETRLFWPKSDWFPEKIFTLKADVVDSAHANNACIGRFINKCAEVGIIDPTPAMSYYEQNKNNFSIPSTCDAKVKHTLEGFPVLLIARFYSNVNRDVRSLGIYSFNLGRDSYYNMGFKLLNKFRNISGEPVGNSVSAPALLGAPIVSEDVLDMNAESWEGRDSLPCETKIDDSYTSELERQMPVKPNGYFWSSLEGHIRHFWENKYPAEGGTSITEFQKFFQQMVLHPYTKGNFSANIGTSFLEYDWNQASGFFIPQSAQVKQIARVGDGGPQYLNFNIPNARFYYIMCLLGGLVDNLGKNLNMRVWKNGSGDFVGKWFTSFYDMDTAFGLDNNGFETVAPDVFDEHIYNNGDALITEFITTDTETSNVYTVKDAKLWGVLDNTEFKRQYDDLAGEASYNSLYAALWNRIREQLIPSVDSFMDEYFGMQTEGVGELIYNQDFTVKYVNTSQKNFMHGDRKAFVRDWLNKRVKFLDSVFGYKQRQGSNPYLTNISIIKDASYNKTATITHDSGAEKVPIISNCPIIISSTIGNAATNYYYLPANTPVDVRLANSGGARNIQTTINNVDCLLDIENFKDMKVRLITPTQLSGNGNIDTTQYGSFSSLTTFDMNGNTSFVDNGIDFIKVFKTWNEGDETKPYALKSIDLSNTKSASVRQFPLTLTATSNMIYKNPFENLTDIDITNSCVTSVELPENVSLFSLKVAGSAVNNVQLRGQSIIDDVDFTGCSALQTLVLNNCSKYKILTLNKLKSLRTITISQCEELEEIYIDCDESKNNLVINVSDTPNLKKFTLINCRGTDTHVALAGATSIEIINLSNCGFNTISLPISCRSTLTSLDLSKSDIQNITWIEEGETNILNLKGCTRLTNFKCAENASIEYIQFDNIENQPINIINNFASCISLKRIYGNVVVKCAGAFRNCTNFSIHGSDIDNVTFNGEDVKNSAGLIKHLTDGESTSDAIHFVPYVSGDGVTNLTFGISNTNHDDGGVFQSTKCTGFDVYYVFWNPGSATGFGSAFRSCRNLGLSCGQTVDNSPHWTMFEKCGNVTSLSATFYSTSLHLRIYSKCNDHHGLFGPLKKCTTFNTVFYNCTYITDRNVFKSYDNTSLSATNISYFQPVLIVEDVNSLTAAEAYARIETPGNYIDESGNLTGFFDEITTLSGVMQVVMNSTRMIDYDTFSAIPSGVTTIRSCFVSTYGKGTLIVGNLFRNRRNVVNIYQSFRVTNTRNPNVTMPINNNTLSGFSNLTRIGYITTTPSGSMSTSSFTGDGINKVIQGEFPYDIIRNSGAATKLIQFVGFFRGATMENSTTTIPLPGTLFNGCTSLQETSYCFYDFNNQYSLVPNGFIGTKLTNVAYMFGSSGYNNFVGSIPNKLFNLGFSAPRTINYVGTTEQSRTMEVSWDSWSTQSNSVIIINNGEPYDITIGEDEEEYTVTINTRTKSTYTNSTLVATENPGILTFTPLSMLTVEEQETDPYSGNWVTKSTTSGEVASDWDITTVSDYTVQEPIKRISNITGCFTRLNADPYVCNNPTVENNPEYCPFNYINTNGVWSKVNYNVYDKTYMWEFDGVNYLNELDGEYLMLDEFTEDESNEIFASWAPILNDTTTPSLYFCAPPDLLRWCTTNATVESLFAYSGHNNNSSLSYSEHSLIREYGIKGRICPYFLLPVKDTTSASSMFRCCTHLYAYNKSGESACLVPKTLFSYTPAITKLQATFAGMTFEKDPDLRSVFIPLTKGIDVQQIFYHTYFSGGTSSDKSRIQNVFSSNNVTNARGAFAQSTMSTTPDTSGTRTWIWNQYVLFSDVFGKSTNNNEYYVFDGYGNYVTHESTPTVSAVINRYNYRLYP